MIRHDQIAIKVVGHQYSLPIYQLVTLDVFQKRG